MIVEHHHTKSKSLVAETLTKLALEELGYAVFITTCEFSPVDLIALDPTTGETLRIQVKYRADGRIPKNNVWSDKNGCHSRPINTSVFDYFAIVDETRKVAFVKPDLVGSKIWFSLPNAPIDFYWWGDMIIGGDPQKRSLADFGAKVARAYAPRPNSIRRDRPKGEELVSLVWSKPLREIAKDYGVSDVAVKKWCKRDGIEVPDRGHWLKK